MSKISIYPTGSSNPDHRQLWEDGEPLPEGYTDLEPPIPSEGHKVIWGNDIWEQVPEASDESEIYTSSPTLIASGVFTIDDGLLKGLEAAAGIAFAFPMGPGLYWLFFSDEQPDKAFSVYPSSSSGQINVTARELDHIELCVTDGGQPVDPSEFSVQVVRLR